MPTIDLNQCFPEATDGCRGPLPKQGELLRLALNQGLPKYIAYVGGIGSGKSLIGCITMLSWAVMYPGDYLVARQFYPELKMTTYKTFLEICPPELIIEHRVADSQVKIHSANGKTSTIYFRPLEEPDKLRSLNLSGFYIDEASQVSEEAFILLQGRLRGSGIRKGIMTTNPAGHDWIYRWFLKKDHLNSDIAKAQYYLIQAPSTENVHLPEGYVESMMVAWSADRIKREIYGSFDAFEGMVYNEFRRDTHVVKGFRIPAEWQRHIRIDSGYRNPTAILLSAVDPDGNVYVYKEFYEREYLIHESILGNPKERKTGLVQMLQPGEKFQTAKIDPAVKARRATTGASDYDEYLRHWPEALPPLGLARNDVQVGIDRVKSYLKVNPKTLRPQLYIFEECKNLLEEITTYRYPSLKSNQEGRKAEDEKPVKINDHALDALRYLIVDLPEPTILSKEDPLAGFKPAEKNLQREIAQFKKPKPKDPFFGF